jgi:hypothetical protein
LTRCDPMRPSRRFGHQRGARSPRFHRNPNTRTPQVPPSGETLFFRLDCYNKTRDDGSVSSASSACSRWRPLPKLALLDVRHVVPRRSVPGPSRRRSPSGPRVAACEGQAGVGCCGAHAARGRAVHIFITSVEPRHDGRVGSTSTVGALWQESARPPEADIATTARTLIFACCVMSAIGTMLHCAAQHRLHPLRQLSLRC